MITLCVREGEAFPRKYVSGLRRQVEEHIGPLLCLGDDIPLREGYTGWWAKMELFSPDNENLRPCLYLDLDTFVLGGCRDMLVPVEKLTMLADFNQPARGASGVMLIPKDTGAIWERWLRERPDRDMSHKDGDGGFLRTFPHDYMQDMFKGIHSYKLDCREGPRGRMICFHGKPKPHETDGWAREIYETW